MRLSRVLRDFPWRRVLALFVACLVCTALWAEATQVRLASQVIRLHVLANSDSEEDQALKLEVRDRVLETTSALLAGETEPQAAAVLLNQHLDDIAQTAAQEISAQGHDDRVEVRLEQTWFPTLTVSGHLAARRKLSGPASPHRSGRGTQLVVRGLSQSLPARRLRTGLRGQHAHAGANFPPARGGDKLRLPLQDARALAELEASSDGRVTLDWILSG